MYSHSSDGSSRRTTLAGRTPCRLRPAGRRAALAWPLPPAAGGQGPCAAPLAPAAPLAAAAAAADDTVAGPATAPLGSSEPMRGGMLASLAVEADALSSPPGRSSGCDAGDWRRDRRRQNAPVSMDHRARMPADRADAAQPGRQSARDDGCDEPR